MSQHFVSLAYLYLECSVSHTLGNSSVNRNHIFSWNDITSFCCAVTLFAASRFLDKFRMNNSRGLTPTCQRETRVVLNERGPDERNRPISLVNLICSSDLPSVNPLTLDRSSLMPATFSIDASCDSSSGLTSVRAAPSRPARAVLPTRCM